MGHAAWQTEIAEIARNVRRSSQGCETTIQKRWTNNPCCTV